MTRGPMVTRWVFTLNNYDEVEESILQQAVDAGLLRYLYYGHEIAPSTGTPHLQGLFITTDRVRVTTIRNWGPPFTPDRMNFLEAMRGTLEEAEDYNGKEDDDPVVYGERPKSSGQMEQERWDDAKEAAIAGRIDDIPSDIFIRCYSSLRSIMKDYAPMPADHTDVRGLWIYGPAGAGKSRYVRDNFPEFYYKCINKWWDGYAGEEIILLDDFDKGHSVLAHHLKIWADRYAFKAEIKGSAVNISPKKIIVTSQYKIEDIWDDQETRDALNRRFEKLHVRPPLRVPHVDENIGLFSIGDE